MNVLVVDVGGSKVKLSLSGAPEPRGFDSVELTPHQLVDRVRATTADWQYDVISLGVPGVVINGNPVAEPGNLGPGWVGFDFKQAFGKPVRLVNDAVLQALGL
jgi:predicted NBD/HSP70 family sugar kinase